LEHEHEQSVTLPTYGKRSRPIKKKVKTTKGTRKYDTEKNAYRNYETVMAHKFLNVCVCVCGAFGANINIYVENSRRFVKIFV